MIGRVVMCLLLAATVSCRADTERERSSAGSTGSAGSPTQVEATAGPAATPPLRTRRSDSCGRADLVYAGVSYRRVHRPGVTDLRVGRPLGDGFPGHCHAGRIRVHGVLPVDVRVPPRAVTARRGGEVALFFPTRELRQTNSAALFRVLPVLTAAGLQRAGELEPPDGSVSAFLRGLWRGLPAYVGVRPRTDGVTADVRVIADEVLRGAAVETVRTPDGAVSLLYRMRGDTWHVQVLRREGGPVDVPATRALVRALLFRLVSW